MATMHCSACGGELIEQTGDNELPGTYSCKECGAGYIISPDTEEDKRVPNFVEHYEDFTNLEPLFDVIREDWWHKEYWHEQDLGDEEYSNGVYRVRQYRISTVGWSFNEELISCLQSNVYAWAACFYSHRTGGHYEFRVKTKLPDGAKPRPDPRLDEGEELLEFFPVERKAGYLYFINKQGYPVKRRMARAEQLF